jgi:hypothetical protein
VKAVANDLQNLIVLVLVGVAGGHLVWRAASALVRRSSSACGGGCRGCSQTSAGNKVPPQPHPAEPSAWIDVEQLAASARRLRD